MALYDVGSAICSVLLMKVYQDESVEVARVIRMQKKYSPEATNTSSQTGKRRC